ncbi:hypothetical protein TrLO_g8781 [Triparma laevis f. longispina]|uniref:Uncharacterized protein n=1 Tax=Triparma laevis f. longispina TaxID=1714387 RepID=A0A9W7EDR0_9STRA|nr:hypothetical protein TrLO_g8781 [Triparma laevis f. longispina]
MSYSRIGSRIGSSSTPSSPSSPTFSPSFGSNLVFSHHQSIGASYVWASPYSLPSSPRQLYAPVSQGGERRQLIEPTSRSPTLVELPNLVSKKFLLSKDTKKSA